MGSPVKEFKHWKEGWNPTLFFHELQRLGKPSGVNCGVHDQDLSFRNNIIMLGVLKTTFRLDDFLKDSKELTKAVMLKLWFITTNQYWLKWAMEKRWVKTNQGKSGISLQLSFSNGNIWNVSVFYIWYLTSGSPESNSDNWPRTPSEQKQALTINHIVSIIFLPWPKHSSIQRSS